MVFNRSFSASWVAVFAAAALAFPIELPAIGGYAPTLSFLLAPLIAWAVLKSAKEPVGLTFITAGAFGLAGVLTSAWIRPDGRLHLDILSLVLLMYTSGFYFLGRHLNGRVIEYFVVFSVAFIVPAALRNVLLHQQVQITTAEDYNVLNVVWFGWKMFGNFGILGAAHMLCLQAALAIGVALSPTRWWIRGAAVAVILCAAFLVVRSESRGALLSLLLILTAVTIYSAGLYRGVLRYVGAALVIIVIAAGATQVESNQSNRFVKTAHEIANMARSAISFDAMDKISSGRFSLQLAAIDEFVSHPVLGSGFSPLGRYEGPPEGMKSATPHLFYLTVLWKGGLLFAIPFFSFFAIGLWHVQRAHTWSNGPVAFMAMVAVSVLFTVMAFTAETPNVPSAGALGFLLLGVLGRQAAALIASDTSAIAPSRSVLPRNVCPASPGISPSQTVPS